MLKKTSKSIDRKIDEFNLELSKREKREINQRVKNKIEARKWKKSQKINPSKNVSNWFFKK